MIGLKRSYIKRADLAWYCDHRHDAKGEKSPIPTHICSPIRLPLPENAKNIKLPANDKIRILAMSVANENPEVTPAQPLYDVLPSPNAGPSDFTLSTSSNTMPISQGRSGSAKVFIMPRGSFEGTVTLAANGLPSGVTASFNPPSTSGSSTLTLTAQRSAAPSSTTVTVTAQSGNTSHTATIAVTVTPILAGTVPVDLSSAYNITGIYSDGAKFSPENSLDGDGFSFSAEAIGREQVGGDVIFKIGPPNAPDVVSGKTVNLPEGKFSNVKILALAVNGDQELQTFNVTYADGTSSTFSQNLSDWASPRSFPGESVAFTLPYRLVSDGSKDSNTFYGFAYSLNLDSSKAVRSVSLPSNRSVLVFGITLLPAPT